MRGRPGYLPAALPSTGFPDGAELAAYAVSTCNSASNPAASPTDTTNTLNRNSFTFFSRGSRFFPLFQVFAKKLNDPVQRILGFRGFTITVAMASRRAFIQLVFVLLAMGLEGLNQPF